MEEGRRIYHHAFVRDLSDAYTRVQSAAEHDLEMGTWPATASLEDRIQAITAGVRFLLEQSECLHREDALLQRQAGLRRERKSMLSDLAHLKQHVRGMGTHSGATGSPTPFLEELLVRASQVFHRAARFLELWTHCSLGEEHYTHLAPYRHSSGLPRSLTDSMSLSRASNHNQPRSREASAHPRSVPLLVATRKQTWPKVRTRESGATETIAIGPEEAANVGAEDDQLTYSLLPPFVDSELASERLSAAYNLLLEYLGSFLGLHKRYPSPAVIAARTARCLGASTDIIAIADAIQHCAPQETPELENATASMYDRSRQLEQAAAELCSPLCSSDSASALRSEAGTRLVAAATSCVNIARECVDRARQLLEVQGDFLVAHDEIETAHIGQFGDSLQAPPQPSGIEVKGFQEVVSGPAATPPIKTLVSPLERFSAGNEQDKAKKPALWVTPTREDVLVASGAHSASTYRSSARYSTASRASGVSTRATTPDHAAHSASFNCDAVNSFASTRSMRRTTTADRPEGDSLLSEKTHAHELLYNKEGQILGGTLPALVKQLTNQHSSPDPQLLTTFFLTFRLFTSPLELTETLIKRYTDVESAEKESTAIRLRVYNIFKGWLESHWNLSTDMPSLERIRVFASEQLSVQHPSAGRRLGVLAGMTSHRGLTDARMQTTQLVPPIGKTSVSLTLQYKENEPTPRQMISKDQLNLLQENQTLVSQISITDFEAIELARQITLVQSSPFCAIQPEELLALEWTRKSEKAAHVRAMSRLSTDLANLVADTILSVEDAKSRAIVIKQWIKIGKQCLDLHNYDCLMAVVCSLTSSTILRLKNTWSLVSSKTKNQLEELKAVVEVSKNYASLRQRLQTHEAPCIPFVGIYLTDLTFLDAGNQDTRTMPSVSEDTEEITVINFDKHVRTAKIISQLQKFQVPYRLHAIPELQAWILSELGRVRVNEAHTTQSFYKRSLQLEPARIDSEPQAKAGAGQPRVFWSSRRLDKPGKDAGDVFSRPGFSSKISHLNLRGKASAQGLNAAQK